jgi:hypothetical protein
MCGGLYVLGAGRRPSFLLNGTGGQDAPCPVVGF